LSAVFYKLISGVTWRWLKVWRRGGNLFISIFFARICFNIMQ